ncbi:hypothetical protein BVC93_27355 [Mycobacterium sp. MS1601]|uniref:hypothetical protein n=1 Tax=Mycobacterium sp. MS1601 TaxID=1936029 RepID=UPI00097966A8|nr:hypothetical protein [Mycobacterium sp. MS1601]AQA05475.1 hypothetical protein BVC93_27355 [Mycobacterium sp. MS1601]
MKKCLLATALVVTALIVAPVAAADNYATQSGRVLCTVTPDSTIAELGHDVVVCQGAFTQPGAKFQAITTGDGRVQWQDANLAVDNPTTVMNYGTTLHSGNWTIYPDRTGTLFTDDRTGHGMFVSIDDVHAF